MDKNIKYNYDEENDILSMWLKNKGTYVVSQELGNSVVVDFDKNKHVIGIEIFDYQKTIKEIQDANSRRKKSKAKNPLPSK